MIDVTKLFSWNYLFEQRPDAQSNLVFVLAVLFGLAVLGSGLTWLYLVRKERREPLLVQVRVRFVPWLFTTGSVGLLLVFFRFEGVPYFASRFWLASWLIGSLIWLVRLLYYLLKKFPKERSLNAERLVRERYLPKSKRLIR